MDEGEARVEPPELPPLHAAAARGDHAEFERLLRAGWDPNARVDVQSTGYTHFRSLTPLMVAAASTCGASVATLRWLIEQGADPHARSESGSTAALYAASAYLGIALPGGVDIPDHAERLRFLLDAGLSPHESAPSGRSLLVAACGSGDADRVRVLQDRGVRLGHEPCEGARNPLFAAVRSGSADLVRLLLQAGADPHALGVGELLLHHVCNAETAELLLGAGVDPRALDSNGEDAVTTLLSEFQDETTRCGRLAAARCILARLGGAKAWDPLGSRLHYAVFWRDADVVALLLECGADAMSASWRESVASLDPCGDSLLHTVSAEGAPFSVDEAERTRRIVEMLVACGCSVDARDAEGRTPLHDAMGDRIGGATTAAAELLLENGADLDATDDLGVTPLMAAAELGELECVRLLLASGADPTLRCAHGKSALDRARLHAAEVGREASADVSSIVAGGGEGEPWPQSRFVEPRAPTTDTYLRPWIFQGPPETAQRARSYRALEVVKLLEDAESERHGNARP